MVKISVVVPAYNEEKLIARTLKALLSQSVAPDEIIVVDNASTDRTAAIARSLGVRVVREPRKGVSKALARGFSAAQGEIIAATDADSRVNPHWVEQIKVAFQENSAIVAVVGPGLYIDGPELICSVSRSPFWLEVLAALAELVGFNFAVRRERYLEVGGFNQEIDSSSDIELGERLRKVGKILFLRELVVYTSGRRFTKGRLFSTLIEYFMNYLGVKLFRKPLQPHFADVRIK